MSTWPSALPSRFGSDRRLPDDYHDNNDDSAGLTSNHLQAGASDHGGFHKQRIHESEEDISKMNTEFFALPGMEFKTHIFIYVHKCV